ncbi:MAG: MFS transporter, partial [Methanogenium sp.]|nr:MFS transporter [Methanogenium sp.]
MTSTSMPETGKRGESARGIALKLIILLGITSLLGSMVSNGAHSVTGPFLLSLGGSAAVVGLVAGAGDFIGYALRLITGPVLAKTRYYWTVTIIGYSLLAAIPLLALAGSWEVAALLIIVER